MLLTWSGEGPARGVPGGWVRELAERFGAAQVCVTGTPYDYPPPLPHRRPTRPICSLMQCSKWQRSFTQVALEHRFYGESTPTACYHDLGCSMGDKFLKYLTVDQVSSRPSNESVMLLRYESCTPHMAALRLHPPRPQPPSAGPGGCSQHIGDGGRGPGELCRWLRLCIPPEAGHR